MTGRYSFRPGLRREYDSGRRCLTMNRVLWRGGVSEIRFEHGQRGAALSAKVVLPTMTLSVFLQNPTKCRGPEASPLDSEQALPPCTRLKGRKPCL